MEYGKTTNRNKIPKTKNISVFMDNLVSTFSMRFIDPNEVLKLMKKSVHPIRS